MKKTMYFSMAALVAMGAILAGCSKKEAPQPENKDNIVTVYTTIRLDDDDATKALDIDYDAKVLSKTFAPGDQITVEYSAGTIMDLAVSDPLQPEDISADGKSAKFFYTMNNPDEGTSVSFHYPAIFVQVPESVDWSMLESQDGTLDNVEILDYATGSLPLADVGTQPVTLVNQVAIVAFTLKDATGANDITADVTAFSISTDSGDYEITRTSGPGPIYVAMYPISGEDIEFSATAGGKSYTKSLTGKTYASNNFYQQGLRMAEIVTPSGGITSPKVGQIICSDGKNYNHDALLPLGVSAIARICYVSGNNGLALALNDDGKANWNTAITTAAAHTPTITGCTWKLATMAEWNWMAISLEIAGFVWQGFFEAVGGDDLLPSHSSPYWSSTDYGYDGYNYCAYAFESIYSDGSFDWVSDFSHNYECKVRACLEF